MRVLAALHHERTLEGHTMIIGYAILIAIILYLLWALGGSVTELRDTLLELQTITAQRDAAADYVDDLKEQYDRDTADNSIVQLQLQKALIHALDGDHTAALALVSEYVDTSGNRWTSK
jgi:hypothetical protein